VSRGVLLEQRDRRDFPPWAGLVRWPLRPVAGALNRPLSLLLQEDSVDEPEDGVVGSAFDLAVEALEAVGGGDFRPMLLGCHIGEYFSLGLVREGEFRLLAQSTPSAKARFLTIPARSSGRS
jgi:hypothetical protein